VRRPSLTTWILFAIVVGGAFGYFFPTAATELRVLSTIFIRLIRTIVAPLLFATLVVGIAGHGNLKQVGRMGVKAIIYFEIVTTLALLIGWAAISISRAGVGITLPPPAPGEQAAVPPPQTWQDILLHVFPENIAKAVADGEVLQVVVFSVIFGAALAIGPAMDQQILRELFSSAGDAAGRGARCGELLGRAGPPRPRLGMGRRLQHRDGHRRRPRRHGTGPAVVLRCGCRGCERYLRLSRLHALRFPQQPQGQLHRPQPWLPLRAKP